MKKLLLCLILCAGLIPSVFASSFDDEDEGSGKFYGLTPGVRLSFIGVEPAFAVDVVNLEVEASCAFTTGYNGNEIGFAPALSVAYISNPFEKGSSAAFGVEYMFLTPTYINLLTSAFAEKSSSSSSSSSSSDEDALGIHAVSLFYKGCYNFNRLVGLTWRIRMPCMIAYGNENINISNVPGFWTCLLAGVCTTSVGVKFTF